MGGNALKKVKVKRLDSLDELQRVQHALTCVLSKQHLRHAFPIELPGKESFGDVDVLLDLKRDDTGEQVLTVSEVQDWMQRTFCPEEIHVNGSVFSMAYESRYQVDFIVVDNLSMARFYFSYGEVGAVIGRCTRAHNLTYGHKGLLTVGLDGDRSILLSECPVHICEFLDLDFGAWQQGFQSVDDINRWLLSSNLFDSSLFEKLNMSHRRQALRPFYRQFLDFVMQQQVNSEWRLRDLHCEAVIRFNRTDEVLQIQLEKEKAKLNKLKFNAQLFMDRGVETRQLAKTMKAFKLRYPEVDDLAAEEILVLINSFLSNREL